MSISSINLGTSPTGAGGDTNREAFTKTNANFVDLDLLTVQTKTAAFTLAQTDNRTVIECTGTFTISLPNGLAQGTSARIINVGTGTITLAASGTITGDGTKLPGGYFVANIYHAGSNVWRAHGDLVTDPVSGALAGVGSTSTSLVDYPKTGSVTTGDYFVDPNAVTNGVGTIGDPFDNLASALAAVSDGQTILVRAGTLALSSNIYRNTTWATGINVYGYGTERPIIDAGALADGNPGIAIMLDTSSAKEHWKGFEVINAPNLGIDIKGVNHTIEDMWVHHCLTSAEASGAGRSAIRSIGEGARNNLIQDCRVWRCGDGVNTTFNAPDCYQIAASSGVQTGSKWVRCFGAHGQDDIFDMWAGSGAEAIDCVAVYGGFYWNGVSGSSGGSGFKAGGSRTGVGGNTVKGCIAIECKSEAIKPNSAPNPVTIINCTVVDSVGAGITADTDPTAGGTHTFTNNISLGNTPNVYSGNNVESIERYNTWNSSGDAGSNSDFPITNAQFVSASFDWSLGAGSPCIGSGDGGVNLGASEVALALAKECLAMDLTT